MIRAFHIYRRTLYGRSLIRLWLVYAIWIIWLSWYSSSLVDYYLVYHYKAYGNCFVYDYDKVIFNDKYYFSQFLDVEPSHLLYTCFNFNGLIVIYSGIKMFYIKIYLLYLFICILVQIYLSVKFLFGVLVIQTFY
jgi:hypothetical protein